MEGPNKRMKAQCYTPAVKKQHSPMLKDLVTNRANSPASEGPGRISRFEQDYEKVRKIGEGHFGSVVQCVHRLDGLDYAIKISKKPTKKHNCLEEALHEVFALSALSVAGENPYIVRYYTGWIESNQLYIVMELCDGSLLNFAEQEHLDEKAIKRVFRDICLGLNELHSKDIVHLDIKPENILRSQNGNFKLADLGLARLLSKLNMAHPEGDMRYLAPEMLDDDTSTPLKKADIFSLGMMLYELMERQQPPRKGSEWKSLRRG